ncbi:MAG: hypothetical protein QXO25_06670, partial [Candidatus Bathyarchaeia archaeon]
LNNFYTEDVFVDPSSALRLSLHSDTTDYYKGDLVVLFGNFTMGASPMTGENLHVIVLSQTSETPSYQASLTTDSAGKYRTVFTLPENTPKGRYTATVTSSRFWTSARISFNVLALKPPDMPILRLTSADAYPFGAAVTLLGKFTNGTRPLPGRIVEITVSDPQGLSVNNLSVATDLDGRFSTKLILNSLATGIFTAQAIEKQSKAIARASFVVYPLAESGKHCREISIETDRSNYVEGDSAMIQVKFTHLLPTCAEPAVIHYHTLKVEVFDSQGKPIRLLHSQNVTETTLLTLRWPVERDGNYRIRASSWLNGKVLEAENSTQVTVQTQRFRFLMDSSLKEKSVLIAIDGNLYRTDQLPLAFYWAAGSTHLIEFDPEQYGGSSTRWLFLQWKGDLMDSDPIQQIASDRSRTVVMIWKKQFYLDVESETGTTSGQGWYDYSSRATFSVSPSWVQTGFFTGKVFAGWTGDSTATDPIADVSMDSPKQVSATWMDVSGISSIVYTLVPYSILELVLLPQVWLSPVLAFALAFWLCLGALLRLIIQSPFIAPIDEETKKQRLLSTSCVQGLLSRLGTVLVIYAPPYALTSGLGVMIQSRIRRRGNPILKQNQ